MGYTHYWKHNGFTDNQWNLLLDTSREIITNTGCKIVNAFGEENTNPLLDDRCISFNGAGDQSCESFYLTKSEQLFEFCKTRRNPYDKVVVGIMKSAKDINPSFIPSSDGDEFDED
jgi:hypothetical protein